MQITGKQKNALIFGLIFLSLAPILGMATDQIILWNQAGITITEDSNVSFQKAWDLSVSIAPGQTVTINFAVFYQNVTAYLRIYGKGRYDEEYGKNTTAPSAVTGRYFLYARPSWESYSYSTTTSVTADRDNSYFIEFRGDGDGSRIWSESGDYVILVYGTNAGTGPNDSEVKFNLTVTIDGPGPILSALFYIAGSLILGLLALSLFLEFRKKLLE